MKASKFYALTCLILLLVISNAFSANYEISGDSIYQHISVLADDSLEGRQVGEDGEW